MANIVNTRPGVDNEANVAFTMFAIYLFVIFLYCGQ